MKREIIGKHFESLLKEYGYKKKESLVFLADREFGYDMVLFLLHRYGRDYTSSILIRRRYNIIEEILAPLIKEEFPSNRSLETYTTINFHENNIKGFHRGTVIYDIPGGNYEEAFKQMGKSIFETLFPFLETLNSIENLYDFTRKDENNSFFTYPNFSRIIIAKLLNKNYIETCKLEYNFINNVLKLEDKEYAQSFNNIYKKLKEKLDTM